MQTPETWISQRQPYKHWFIRANVRVPKGVGGADFKEADIPEHAPE